MNNILMVDDDTKFLKVYSKILTENGYKTATASSGEDALQLMKQNYFNMAVVDIMMPTMNGIDLLKILKKEYPSLIVMILTGEGSIEGAVEAMKLGAYTYMSKPVNIDNLLNNVKRASELYVLNAQNISLKNIERDYTKSILLGESKFVKTTMGKIEKAGPANSTVLITGESGTGKEVIADLIHKNSLRNNGAFIKVNCGALSENILESELFGYEKGAFTGATTSKQGRFELANGGTLFMDEIGDISGNLQQMLLRVIQEKTFERVGGITTIHSDFRLICATNKDLSEEIKQGRFREDLYYRINVIPITTEPLRNHSEDIPILFKNFVDHYSEEMNKPKLTIDDKLNQRIIAYNWPGNVRELKNFAERMVVFASGNTLTSHDFSMFMNEDIDISEYKEASTYHDAEKQFQKKYLRKKLLENDWNITHTAEKIQVSRKTLQLKIKELNINK